MTSKEQGRREPRDSHPYSYGSIQAAEIVELSDGLGNEKLAKTPMKWGFDGHMTSCFRVCLPDDTVSIAPH